VRVAFLVLVFGLVGAFSSARADVIFSGSVRGETATGSPCLATGSAYGSISIECSTGNGLGTGMVKGSGDAFSGNLEVESSQESGVLDSVRVTAEGEVDLEQTYVMAGGSGAATVNFRLFAVNNEGPDFAFEHSCLFTFNGVSQSCETQIEAGSGMISEQVEYGVPFSIGFDLTLGAFAASAAGAGQVGYIDYFIDGPGLTATPTPEPSSLSLLIPGLAGVLFAARSRLRSRLG
jgi:hypothetical protein